jgi:hypothetical protein
LTAASVQLTDEDEAEICKFGEAAESAGARHISSNEDLEYTDTKAEAYINSTEFMGTWQ